MLYKTSAAAAAADLRCCCLLLFAAASGAALLGAGSVQHSYQHATLCVPLPQVLHLKRAVQEADAKLAAAGKA